MKVVLAVGLALALVSAWFGLRFARYGGEQLAFQIADVPLGSTAGRFRFREGTRPTLLVFGYTHCGDTCPLTLAAISRFLSQRPERRAAPRAVFVDIDPWEDDAAAVSGYVARFPHVVGAWGSANALGSISSSLGVPPVRGPATLMWHDARVFVLDEHGVLLGTIAPDSHVSVLNDALRQLLSR